MDIPGHAFTEKAQITQLEISFHDDNFRVDFFQRHKFCHV